MNENIIDDETFEIENLENILTQFMKKGGNPLILLLRQDMT